MLKKICLLILGIVCLVGCKTKFSVNGEYVEKAVVHFLLDQGEEYHFLKLNRTFLKEGNAMEFAKEPELSYFDNVVAVVKEIKNGVVSRTWTLKDTTITNKESGAFYAPEQKLYYFKSNNLDDNAIYRLEIDVDNGNHKITGQTKLVKGISIKYPQPNQSFNFADNNVEQNGYKGTPISFNKSVDGALYKMQLKIYYKEYNLSGDEDKTLLWDLGTVKNEDLSGANPTIVAEGKGFYEYLSKKIPNDPNVYRRTLTAMEIILTAGAPDLYTYMLTNEPTSSLAQTKPTFSNVDGALGIFSSRVTIKQFKPVYIAPQTRCLNMNSTKELCQGSYTQNLNFCSDIPLDNSYSFFCN
ncbi:MAG: DUF4249 family protein [Brumimicrobium sp.]|nr:DUF4249 family protein [Brumimicrobium sp.]